MVAHHIAPRHLVKRQSTGAPPLPQSGFDTSATVKATGDVSGVSTLAIDPGAKPTGPPADNGLASPTSPTVVTPPPTTTPSQSVSPSSGVSRQISMSTVIGSCVGAFVGAVALVTFGLWMYRRYTRSLKKVRARGPISSDARHARGEGRPRSRSDPWNKLEDEGDVWEGKNQTKEVEQLGMEKLTMFKKSSPSVRTNYTHKSDEPLAFNMDSHPFGQYHPGLAKELAAGDGAPAMPAPQPFLSRVQTGSPMSWDAAAASDGSFLQLRPNQVVHVEDGQSADVNESSSFDSPNSYGQSTNNPFFSAHEHTRLPPEQQSPTTQSPKGKERAYDTDPFGDENIPPAPAFAHQPGSSTSSMSSNDRAMQSLIAALSVTEDDVQARLRIASMQPSVVSTTSMYTSGEEDDVTHEFPNPPFTMQRR
ncbi:hypothetical protein BD779DRAFT_1494832 [Infundibulicybe gibba]|nr:hypothetical protein BD779DRAFT_1494832 [Infundibulicybe gibba]